MRRRLSTPAALAVLMVGLTACTGDTGSGLITEAPSYPNQGSDDGGESPDESDGGGEGDGDEQSFPDIPAPDPADYPGMDENTPEGAEQAFRYFWASATWGHQTGESSSVEAMSTSDCVNCAELVEEIDVIGSDGTYWSEYELSDLHLSSVTEHDEYDVVVTYGFEVPSHSEKSSDGESRQVEAQQLVTIGGLAWSGDSWEVGDVASSEVE